MQCPGRGYFFGLALPATLATFPVEDLPGADFPAAGGAFSIHGFVLMDLGVILVDVSFLGITGFLL